KQWDDSSIGRAPASHAGDAGSSPARFHQFQGSPRTTTRIGALGGWRRIPVVQEGSPMCDYSLHHVASRPAKIGEKLVTTGFGGTSTRGFAAVDDPTVAVCLLPGTEVVFEREAEYEHVYNRLLPLPRLGKLGHSLARFRQVNVEQPHAHHDA